MPSSEKLTQGELEEIENLKISNQIFTSYNDIKRFLTIGSIPSNNSCFFRIFNSKFLNETKFNIITHIKLNKESENETINNLNFLRRFNNSIEVGTSTNTLTMDQDFISDIISKVLKQMMFKDFSSKNLSSLLLIPM
jgi:hypothetical protein